MKLPNAQRAVIDREKILAYLLNAAHPDNSGKAEFFLSLGFADSRWEMLARAFAEMAERDEVSKTVESPHGAKYILEGQLQGPDGRRALVRTIWIVDRGEDTPRLVTAYPAKGRADND